MNVIEIKNSKEIVQEVQTMNWETKAFHIEDDAILDFVKDYVELLQAFHRGKVCDFGVYHGDSDHNLENTYRFRWTEKAESPAKLIENDLNFKEICTKVMQDRGVLTIEFSEKLSLYIGKFCKSIGVALKNTPEKGMFIIDARAKKESVYKRIENAMNAGLEYLDLNPEDAAIQTVRVYATQINKFTNKRVQVSYYNDFIRVYFKEKKDAYYEAQAKKLFDTISRDLGQTEAILIFNDFIPQPTEKPYDDNLEIE